MDKKSLISYIENSFLKEILEKEGITDISYNGKSLYYVSNIFGRMKYSKEVSLQEVKDFIRQLANISEKQFSYLNPILDIAIGRYRINAVNSAVARLGLEESLSFSIRIAQKKRMINHDETFMGKELEDLFDELIKEHVSIIISGTTGVGKTEFQKYLISRMEYNERVLIIDHTIELSELDLNSDLDITLWQASEKNNESSISSLIKCGLRNNPDWMIISEARGEEMNDVLNSAMTGIPIITTIHSFDAYSAPKRMGRMIMGSKQNISYQDIIHNIYYHFRIYVHLIKEIRDAHIYRYISSIIQIDEDGSSHLIYLDDGNKKQYGTFSSSFIEIMKLDRSNKSIRRFIKNE